jgi:hypothetical protein
MAIDVKSPMIETVLKSGQITVAAAGTAVQGTDVTGLAGFYLTADTDNAAGIIFVGNDGAGDVTADNGFPLAVGQTIHVAVRNLNELWFDASVNGNKVCWLKA